MRYGSFAITLVLLVGCADSSGCPETQALNAQGTACVDVPCDGGQVAGGACVCPDGFELTPDANVPSGGTCVRQDSLCAEAACAPDGNPCTVDCTEDGNVATCAYEPEGEGTPCDTDDGPGMCTDGQCVVEPPPPACDGINCDDGNACTTDTCSRGVCSYENAADDTACEADVGDGLCRAGVCTEDLCAVDSCDDGNQCKSGGVCSSTTGNCEGRSNVSAGTACDQDGGSLCDGNGNCVECVSEDDCASGGECTETTCVQGMCMTSASTDGTTCDFDGGPGECSSGTCMEATCDPPCVDDDPTDCSKPVCPSGQTVCQADFEVEGKECTKNGVPGGRCDGAGECDLCAEVVCDAPSECKTAGVCNESDGECGGFGNVAEGTACGAAGVCDGAGNCVNPCSLVEDGATCDPVGGGLGVCVNDTCRSAFECSTAGVNQALAQGAGPHYFACQGDPQVVISPSTPLADGGFQAIQDVTLDGLGRLELSGVQQNRVLRIESGVAVTLRNIVLSNGDTTGDGGAVSMAGDLTLVNCTVESSHADGNGGGIAVGADGELTLINSTVEGNTADDDAGGIRNNGTTTLVGSDVTGNMAVNEGGGIQGRAGSETFVTDGSSVLRNTSGSGGGGIRVFRSMLEVTDSLVANNESGSVGGGISSYGDTAGTTTVDIVRSTVSGNTSENRGGGVEAQWTRNTLTIRSSAIVRNISEDGGGGLYVQDGATANVTNTTIAENEASIGGGGLRLNDDNSEANFVHCTFRGNTTGTSGEAIAMAGGLGEVTVQNSLLVNDCSGDTTLTSLGGNIESTSDSCGFTAGTGDEVVQLGDLSLGALQLNGGTTVNYLPGAGSRAIDFAECVTGVSDEQRGLNSRPTGTLCDCGSVEAP
ncbi:MAG: right-handed parallel beta-helix repeat-containing protein [Myxococcota bacterium]